MNSEEEAVWQEEIDIAWAQVDRLEEALELQRIKARELEQKLCVYMSHAELVALVRDFLRSTFGI